MVDLIHITHPSIPHLDASKGHYEFKVRSEELSNNKRLQLVTVACINRG